MRSVRLVTWNVNSLRARLPRLLELLARHASDVVCLQETKIEPGAFPHAEARWVEATVAELRAASVYGRAVAFGPGGS